MKIYTDTGIERDNENGETESHTRNEGVQLLRIISMMMIIGIHLLGKGGLFEATEFGTEQHFLVVILKAFVVSSVNCFVLISGFFLVEKPYRTERITKTVLLTLEYSLILSAICFIIHSSPVSLGNLLYTIFPVPMQDTYWFVTVYVSMLLLSPLLNRTTINLSKEQHRIAIAILLVLFSLIPTLTMIKKIWFSTGNDIVWFCVLYFIAAYIRKYGITWEKNSILILCGGGMTIVGYYTFGLFSKSVIGSVGDIPNSLFAYNSPFTLMISLGLFGLSLKINIKGEGLRNVVNKVGSHTFGIYLWHNHFLFREIIWLWLMPSTWVNRNVIVVFVLFLASIIGIFVVGFIIDTLRSRVELLFVKHRRRLRILQNLDNTVNMIIE